MKRIEWIDVAKFIGIMTIYIGHFGKAGGLSYPFAFMFHVPLFFFLAGCVETLNKEKNFGKNLLKKVKGIVVPLIVFFVISVVVFVFNENMGIDGVVVSIKSLLKGLIRNDFYACSLWFLTCLLVVYLMFLLLKFLKSKWVILIVAFILNIVSGYLSPNMPAWFFNVDSAMYYLVYYVIGYVSLPYIQNLFNTKNVYVKIACCGVSIISVIITVLFYFRYNILGFAIPILTDYLQLFFIFWAIISVSHLLSNVKLFKTLGQNTLYLCGNEYIVKALFENLFGMIGLGVVICNQLTAYVYTFGLIVCVVFVFVPIEKRIVNYILSLFESKSKYRIDRNNEK